MRHVDHFITFFNEFNKFNNTIAQILDSIYHMTQTIILLSRFWRENIKILSDTRDVAKDIIS